LIPFVYPEGIICADYFNIYEPYEFIAQCIRFTIHCMYGLHILHEKLKIVHDDLKPNNIMYSKVDNSWKIRIIDFDHSAPIEESSQIERRAGTKGFWAPECQNENGTGIFAPASDIFAFGKIIEDVFFLFLMGIACAEPVQRDLEKGCFVITRLMHQMRKTAVKDRPTALRRVVIKQCAHYY
jgi:serine/threonine protein kinase